MPKKRVNINKSQRHHADKGWLVVECTHLLLTAAYNAQKMDLNCLSPLGAPTNIPHQNPLVQNALPCSVTSYYSVEKMFNKLSHSHLIFKMAPTQNERPCIIDFTHLWSDWLFGTIKVFWLVDFDSFEKLSFSIAIGFEIGI